MAEAPENQEPSMEEILASIRRIISEDGAAVQPAPPSEDAPVPELKAEEPLVLELMEEVGDTKPADAVEEPALPIVEMEDFVFEPIAEMPAPEPQELMPRVEIDADSLLSDAAAMASVNALSGLSRLKASVDIQSFPINGSMTLEHMVYEHIKPILKDWLDANLPTLVERVVQKEIQKITRNLG
jgi:cell pole-organizing protein PopZ